MPTQEELAQRAMNSQTPPQVGFGKASKTLKGVIWENNDQGGGSYVDFVDGKHDLKRMITEIHLSVNTLKKDGTYWTLTKKYRDNNAPRNPWRDITRPSMAKLGLGLTTIDGVYVKYERRRTGHTWSARDTGETMYEDTFYFLEVFPSEDAMRAAYTEFYYGEGGSESESGASAPSSSTNGAAAGGQAEQSEMDDPAKRALVTIWNTCKQDEDKFKTTFSKNKVLNKELGGRFTLDEALAIAKGEEDEDVPF